MQNWSDFQPILIIPAIPNHKGIRFLRQDAQLDISEEATGIVWAVLMHCNGYRIVEEIAELSGIDITTTKQLLSELLEMGAIIDSREQYMHYHHISSNPATYIRTLTHEKVREHEVSPRKSVKDGTIIHFEHDAASDLAGLLERRRSCRSFSANKLTRDQIGNICSRAYSIQRHVVPSGGALYPLKIFALIAEDQDGIERGYYEYSAENDFLVRFIGDPDREQLKYCLNDEYAGFNSPAQIIIAADLSRQSYKYSNRGYRLTLLEAGHVAQNICLYCTEQEIATCELGGLLDEALVRELGLEQNGVFPLLAIAVGKKSDEPLFDYAASLEELERRFVGSDKPVKTYGTYSFKAGDASFFGAWARYGDCEHQIAGATAPSYFFAAYKAIIEGYERYCSERVGPTVVLSRSRQDPKIFISPNELAPLDPVQRQLCGLAPYSDDTEISWTKTMDGLYVPTDLVFYGHQNPTVLYGNSSGIAAFSDYEEAKKRALVELIERDALMRNWFEQKSPKRISRHGLPTHVQRKIEHWGKHERNVYVLDMGSPFLPVYQVVIVSNCFPYFVSGAAAASTRYDAQAISKALQEAEYNLLLAVRYPTETPPEKEEVKLPADHGHFYHFEKNAEKIAWLWSGKETTQPPVSEFSDQIDELVRQLGVLYADLSEDNSPIKVVRAFSSKLIPINFGYGLDHYTHPEVKELAYNPKSRELPHYFA